MFSEPSRNLVHTEVKDAEMGLKRTEKVEEASEFYRQIQNQEKV